MRIKDASTTITDESPTMRSGFLTSDDIANLKKYFDIVVPYGTTNLILKQTVRRAVARITAIERDNDIDLQLAELRIAFAKNDREQLAVLQKALGDSHRNAERLAETRNRAVIERDDHITTAMHYRDILEQVRHYVDETEQAVDKGDIAKAQDHIRKLWDILDPSHAMEGGGYDFGTSTTCDAGRPRA